MRLETQLKDKPGLIPGLRVGLTKIKTKGKGERQMSNYGKNEILHILMKRDNLSRNEAQNIIDECQEVINDIFDSEMDDFERMEEVEFTIQDYLGLEPDYIFAFL